MIRVYTKIILDMDTLEIIEQHSYAYEGPVDYMKGDQSKIAEAAAAEAQKQQMLVAQQQLAMQNQQLNQVNAGVNQFLTPQGQGFDPATLAAMNSQAIQGNSQQFEQIRQQLTTQLAQRGGVGGNQPVSGMFLKNMGSLDAQQALGKSSQLEQIQMANAQQALQNRFAAANASLGVASGFSPNAWLGGSNSALGNYVTAAHNVDQAKTGIFGSLLGGLAGTVIKAPF